MQLVSRIVVTDAYFSKYTFVNQLCKNDFDVISKFRKDVRLQYLFIGTQKTGRGRHRKFQGKVDKNNLDMNHFNLFQENDKQQIYHAVVHATALKRLVNLVCTYKKKIKMGSESIFFYRCKFRATINFTILSS